MSELKIIGWHFIGTNRRLGYDDNRPVMAGETLSVDPPIELCKRGLHASRRAIDALNYAPGPIVSRVELSGEIMEGTDKIVATHRKTLWLSDATNVLHEFACVCAEDALRNYGVTDKRCWAAITAKRKWLAREITDEKLDAARDAARAAARDAARAAAWAATWAAAWAAAGAAAWAAAGEEQSRNLEFMLEALNV